MKDDDTRIGSTIPASSAALIWQDVDGTWGTRIHYADVWPVTRYPTAEDAIEARDKMRDDYRTFFGEALEVSDVGAAKNAVARACLENRGALEQAWSYLYDLDAGEEIATELREILQALDDWHTASIEVMKGTGPAITPEEADALATK